MECVCVSIQWELILANNQIAVFAGFARNTYPPRRARAHTWRIPPQCKEHRLELGSCEGRECAGLPGPSAGFGEFCGRRWTAMDSDAVQLAKQMRARIVEPTVRKGADTPWHARGDVRCISSFVFLNVAPSPRLFACLAQPTRVPRAGPLCWNLARCGRLPPGSLKLPKKDSCGKAGRNRRHGGDVYAASHN